MNQGIFRQQLPFAQEDLQALYTSICMDDVKRNSKLSDVAWSLITQVGRHSAE